MTHIRPTGKYPHSGRSIALSLALKTGKTYRACQCWLQRQRCGHRQPGYYTPPTLQKSDWTYIGGEAYFTDRGRDKLASLSANMRQYTKKNQ